MSKVPTSRRAVILGAGGLAAAGALSAAAPVVASEAGSFGPLSPQACAVLAQLRYTRSRYHEADSRADDNESQEGQPGFTEYQAALEQSEALNKEFEKLVKRLTKEPARSWDDIVIRAEICRLQCEDYGEQDETLSDFPVSVLSIAGCMPQPEAEPEVPAGSVIKLSNRPGGYRADYDIIFAGHLIGHFRDTAKAAKYFDVPGGCGLGLDVDRFAGSRSSSAMCRGIGGVI
jgi:hypothetical protein